MTRELLEGFRQGMVSKTPHKIIMLEMWVKLTWLLTHTSTDEKAQGNICLSSSNPINGIYIYGHI